MSIEDFKRVLARRIPDRIGQPICGIDLGGGRAWSAAVAVWCTGRIEALASALGIPGLAEQETRDRVATGTYQRLVDRGLLAVAEGLRVQPVGALWQAILDAWGVPASIICDRFRLAELQDAVRGACPVQPRMARWSEASEDIRALRKGTKDGPLAMDGDAALLIGHSLSVAKVQNDTQGSTRLVKKTKDNGSRDDVAQALVLCAGGFWRAQRRPVGPSHIVIG